MANYIVAMATTIQVNADLLEELKQMKMYGKESYEEVIWDLIEDSMALSEETRMHIEQSLKEIKQGKVYTHEQVKKALGL